MADTPPEEERVLDQAVVELLYIPDFLLDDLRFWFVPSRENPNEVYHELVGKSAENWATYYSRKGWGFIHGSGPAERDGPWRVREGGIDLSIQEAGRFLLPKPQFRFGPDAPPLPLPSIEKRRPINPWKPTYIRALEFIKKYEWPRPVSRRVMAAVWEIEECGEIAGSVSWRNAESMLLREDDAATRETLQDIFYNRPEDFPLGSEVYLRVLGNLGEDGFARLVELAKHPVSRKRRQVARTLGDPQLGRQGPSARTGLDREKRVEALLLLLDDEDPHVREAALRSLGRVRLGAGDDPQGKVQSYLESDEISHRVWAAEALVDRDPEQRKYLVGLVKEEARPLADLGELGEVIEESGLYDVVPFLIQRLKDGRMEIALDAAEVLGRLTGLELDEAVHGGDEEKRKAIKACSRWWEDYKRRRRQERES